MEEIEDSSEVIIFDEPQPAPVRDDHHVIATSSFKDGSTNIIEADELVLCIPTRDCVQFWATIIICFIVIILTIIGMALFPQDSALFNICVGFFGLAWGVLVPSPNAANMKKKRT